MNGETGSVHEVPEYEGGVNGETGSVHAASEYQGGVNGETGSVHEVPEYEGGVNGDSGSVHAVSEYEGGVNGETGSVHVASEFAGGVNGSDATIREELHQAKLPASITENPLALSLSNDRTYKAPSVDVMGDKLPETGSEDVSPLAPVGLIGLLLSMFAVGKKKED